jgi:hypothetical protein
MVWCPHHQGHCDRSKGSGHLTVRYGIDGPFTDDLPHGNGVFS